MSTINVRMTRDHTYDVDKEAGVTRRIPNGWVGHLDATVANAAIEAGDAEDLTPKETTSEEAPKSAADVLAMAENGDVAFPTFKAAATKLLGDKTPAKKEEIVEALRALLAAS